MKTREQRLIATVQIARKQLQLDDDTYRMMLQGTVGKSSCKGLSEAQLHAVIGMLKTKGWKPNTQQRRRTSPQSRHKAPVDKSMADKIRALWIHMHKTGIVEDGSEKALGRYCYRMTRKYSPDWLTAAEAIRIIESLKQWQARREASHED